MISAEGLLGGIIGGGIVAVISTILQHQSSKKLNKFGIVNESQFRAFSELWKSLMDLKNKGDDLWNNVTGKNLLDFIQSLKEADRSLESNSIILNEEDYQNLKNILNKFSDYQVGKTRLADIDTGKIKAERKTGQLRSGAIYIYDERQDQVFQNESTKKEYELLLQDLRRKFQDKMEIK